MNWFYEDEGCVSEKSARFHLHSDEGDFIKCFMKCFIKSNNWSITQFREEKKITVKQLLRRI